jgi:hypothetical protein
MSILFFVSLLWLHHQYNLCPEVCAKKGRRNQVKMVVERLEAILGNNSGRIPKMWIIYIKRSDCFS